MTEVGQIHDATPAALQRLLADVPHMRGPAPVHLWNPAYCGEIDMRIAADGTWFYNGSPIHRPAMVKLFATILRKDPERYVLVTPVERIGIVVDDAPFLAVELDTEPSGSGDRLFLRTNLDDVVEVGRDHPLRFDVGKGGGLKPYVRVRGDLWALVSRALTHELMQRGVTRPLGDAGTPWFGIASGAEFYPIAMAEDLEEASGATP